MSTETIAFILIALGALCVIARLLRRECPTDERRIGPYELIERVGSGGMGEVWRAKHERLSRPVAIKIAHAEYVQTEEQQARFSEEARTTALVRSPHTAELYDYGTTCDGRHYYAMELIEGENLQDLVQNEGAQSVSRVVEVLTQAARALAEVHDRGLVHRDIKPSNIVLSDQGAEANFVKVVDFGLVEPVRREARAPESVSGSPPFMAPELVVGGDLDGRVDVYALGCVGYFMLTGEHVFSGSSPLEIIGRHVSLAPEPPSLRVGQAIDHALERLILECLSKDPSRRPRDGAALLTRLESIDADAPPTVNLRRSEIGAKASSSLTTTVSLAAA